MINFQEKNDGFGEDGLVTTASLTLDDLLFRMRMSTVILTTVAAFVLWKQHRGTKFGLFARLLFTLPIPFANITMKIGFRYWMTERCAICQRGAQRMSLHLLSKWS